MSNTELGLINVLLIDDQELARLALKGVLGKLGVSRIATCESGVEAIERLRQADPAIDIIICDLDMPEMTGWEFIREIRDGTVADCEDIPILMRTGMNTDYTMAGEQHRIDGFIAKPATAELLRAHMIRVLGLSAG